MFSKQAKEDKRPSFFKRDPSTKGDHFILNKHSSFDIRLMNTSNSIMKNDPMSWFIDLGANVKTNICSKQYTRWFMGSISTLEIILLSRSMQRDKLNSCLRGKIS